MAFETADRLSIARIAGLSVVEVDLHLLTYAPVISSDIESAVLSLISEYDDLPDDDGVEVFPNVANFGARVRNARVIAEERIKSRLFGLLSLQIPNASTVYMERG